MPFPHPKSANQLCCDTKCVTAESRNRKSLNTTLLIRRRRENQENRTFQYRQKARYSPFHLFSRLIKDNRLLL